MPQTRGCPRRPDERHVEWRSRCLRAGGFEPRQASRLARDPTFDLHVLLDLVDRGCRPELAERVLAPLESPESPR